MIEIRTLQRQTLICCLIDALRAKGNWCGATHVQKTMFFLDELTDHAVGYDFILYKHGPFSFELSEDLSVMDARRFVEDEIINVDYGSRLKTNPAARKMLTEKFGQLASQLHNAMTFVVSNLADCGVVTLERLGTALYITRKEHVDGQEARAQRIHEVKPHVTETQALEAVKKVDAILAEWAALQAPMQHVTA